MDEIDEIKLRKPHAVDWMQPMVFTLSMNQMITKLFLMSQFARLHEVKNKRLASTTYKSKTFKND